MEVILYTVFYVVFVALLMGGGFYVVQRLRGRSAQQISQMWRPKNRTPRGQAVERILIWVSLIISAGVLVYLVLTLLVLPAHLS